MEVHFITALCENMVSAQAMRPGDILVASNGKTIEVLNTDAEGRLTLADALVYAEKQGVDTIVDLATLTGATPCALSYSNCGAAHELHLHICICSLLLPLLYVMLIIDGFTDADGSLDGGGRCVHSGTGR